MPFRDRTRACSALSGTQVRFEGTAIRKVDFIARLAGLADQVRSRGSISPAIMGYSLRIIAGAGSPSARLWQKRLERARFAWRKFDEALLPAKIDRKVIYRRTATLC